MLYTKEHPRGLDVLIQKLQTKIYKSLKTDKIEGYGRVYLNDDNGKIVPKHYLGNGEDKELLLNDRLTGSFFFFEDGVTKKKSSRLTTPVSLVILLNLEELTLNFKGRNDEEVKTDIYGVIEPCKYFDLIEIIKGDDVLKEFKTNFKEKHPYCFLRFNGTMSYQGIY